MFEQAWQIVYAIGGCVVGAFGTGYMVSRGFEKALKELNTSIMQDVNVKYASLEERIREYETAHSDKHTLIFRRFDEYKDHVEKDLMPQYVHKESWVLQNASTQAALGNLNNQVMDTNNKIDSLKTLIITHFANGAK